MTALRILQKGEAVHTAVLVVAALIDIGFAIFHSLFWHLFGWPEKLAPLGTFYAVLTQTMNMALILIFTVYGSALLGFSLAHHPAPILFALAGAIFWGIRAVLQPLFLKLGTWQTIALTLAFAVAAIVHGLVAVYSAQSSL